MFRLQDLSMNFNSNITFVINQYYLSSSLDISSDSFTYPDFSSDFA